MYLQIGKQKKGLHPAVAAASGMFIGAAAGAAATLLSDEKNRRMVGNKLKMTTKFAKDKISQLHPGMEESDDDMSGSAGGLAKKTRKSTTSAM